LRSWNCGTAAVEEEAAAGGEAAAFGFVGRRDVAGGVLHAARESWVEGIEVAGVERRRWEFGG
jgi:hypothetical protein